MNPKIANLIAIEAGILVGLMSWLTYSRLPSNEARPPAEMRESSVAPVKGAAPATAAAPAFASSNQLSSAGEYSPEREQARLMAERAASLESYYRTVAAQSYTRSAVQSGSIPADSPSYSEVNQEPAAASADYQTPAQTVIYYAPPITTVVVDNSRPFRNRRSAQRFNGAQPPIARQHPNRIRDSFPPPPPVPLPPRVKPPGVFSPPVVTGGGQPKKIPLPESPGTSRRQVP